MGSSKAFTKDDDATKNDNCPEECGSSNVIAIANYQLPLGPLKSEKLREAIDLLRVSVQEKYLLGQIAACIDWNRPPIESLVSKSIAEFGYKADLSDRQVRRILKRLEVHGYIAVNSRRVHCPKRGRKINRLNQYSLTPLVFCEARHELLTGQKLAAEGRNEDTSVLDSELSELDSAIEHLRQHYLSLPERKERARGRKGGAIKQAKKSLAAAREKLESTREVFGMMVDKEVNFSLLKAQQLLIKELESEVSKLEKLAYQPENITLYRVTSMSDASDTEVSWVCHQSQLPLTPKSPLLNSSSTLDSNFLSNTHSKNIRDSDARERECSEGVRETGVEVVFKSLQALFEAFAILFGSPPSDAEKRKFADRESIEGWGLDKHLATLNLIASSPFLRDGQWNGCQGQYLARLWKAEEIKNSDNLQRIDLLKELRREASGFLGQRTNHTYLAVRRAIEQGWDPMLTCSWLFTGTEFALPTAEEVQGWVKYIQDQAGNGPKTNRPSINNKKASEDMGEHPKGLENSSEGLGLPDENQDQSTEATPLATQHRVNPEAAATEGYESPQDARTSSSFGVQSANMIETSASVSSSDEESINTSWGGDLAEPPPDLRDDMKALVRKMQSFALENVCKGVMTAERIHKYAEGSGTTVRHLELAYDRLKKLRRLTIADLNEIDGQLGQAVGEKGSTPKHQPLPSGSSDHLTGTADTAGLQGQIPQEGLKTPNTAAASKVKLPMPGRNEKTTDSNFTGENAFQARRVPRPPELESKLNALKLALRETAKAG